MYYIDDYRKNAVESIIPYLIEFPQIIKIIENSADRYQAIEDVMWRIAENFKVENSRGVFLNAHAHNEVVDLIYTDKAEDAFTYGTDKPLYQAYGTGHYYSQTSYISGIKKTISEDKLIRAVLAKIIQNNTKCTVEEVIQGLKLLYNAQTAKLFESDPLIVKLFLSGQNLELSSSGNYENIKRMLPVCVNLESIFVDPRRYDLFLYDEKSSYGDSRYPILVGDTTDIYSYKSHAINLTAKDKEYTVLTHRGSEEDSFYCFCGEFSALNNGDTLFSINENTNTGVNFQVIENDGKKYVGINYNGNVINSNFEVELHRRYTFLLSNSNHKLGLWCYPNIILKGRLLEDASYLAREILAIEPNVKVENFTSPNAPIYINCKNLNNVNSDYGNFIYYAGVFGKMNGDSATLTEYYVTCYGEKQIIFNCIDNTNNLYLKTSNPLTKDITVTQPYFNYKATHGHGKYPYFDGKTSMEYKLADSDIDCTIDDFELAFKVSQPVEAKPSIVLSNIVNPTDQHSGIYLSSDGRIYFVLQLTREDGTNREFYFYSDENIIKQGTMPFIKIIYKNKKLSFYRNDKLFGDYDVPEFIKGIPSILKLGKNYDNTEHFQGFISNVALKINAHKDDKKYKVDLNAPLQYRLYDYNNNHSYTHNGIRFITVPQLIDDTNNKDIYGYDVLWGRN